MTATLLCAGLVALNALTALRFWQDKRHAIRGERRVPEADLLGLALIGGSPGALLARGLFRHKTRKRSFSAALFAITAAQLIALLAAARYFA